MKNVKDNPLKKPNIQVELGVSVVSRNVKRDTDKEEGLKGREK